jgi:hypothetical protein
MRGDSLALAAVGALALAAEYRKRRHPGSPALLEMSESPSMELPGYSEAGGPYRRPIGPKPHRGLLAALRSPESAARERYFKAFAKLPFDLRLFTIAQPLHFQFLSKKEWAEERPPPPRGVEREEAYTRIKKAQDKFIYYHEESHPFIPEGEVWAFWSPFPTEEEVGLAPLPVQERITRMTPVTVLHRLFDSAPLVGNYYPGMKGFRLRLDKLARQISVPWWEHPYSEYYKSKLKFPDDLEREVKLRKAVWTRHDEGARDASSEAYATILMTGVFSTGAARNLLISDLEQGAADAFAVWALTYDPSTGKGRLPLAPAGVFVDPPAQVAQEWASLRRSRGGRVSRKQTEAYTESIRTLQTLLAYLTPEQREEYDSIVRDFRGALPGVMLEAVDAMTQRRVVVI